MPIQFPGQVNPYHMMLARFVRFALPGIDLPVEHVTRSRGIPGQAGTLVLVFIALR